MKSVVSFGYVFEKGSKPYTFSTFQICQDTGSISFRDGFTDLTANSILGVRIISIAIKIAFWILSSTVSTMLPFSLSILSLKHIPKVWTFTTFFLAVKLLPLLSTVNVCSVVPSLPTTSCSPLFATLPIMISWSKSSNWLGSFLFNCFFSRVQTVFALTSKIYLQQW